MLRYATEFTSTSYYWLIAAMIQIIMYMFLHL